MEETNFNENQSNGSGNQFVIGLLAGIAIVSVIGLVILGVAYLNKDNDTQVAGETEQADDAITQADQSQLPTNLKWAEGQDISTFIELIDADICKEGGKPVVYLFTTTWCPHCTWIKDTYDATMKDLEAQGKVKAYHWELDTNDDSLTSEVETEVPSEHLAVYQMFNPDGSIPTFVFGCKYFRIGNGHEAQQDLTAEAKEFEALVNLMQ